MATSPAKRHAIADFETSVISMPLQTLDPLIQPKPGKKKHMPTLPTLHLLLTHYFPQLCLLFGFTSIYSTGSHSHVSGEPTSTQRHCEIWLLQKSWDDPSPCLRRSRPARLVFFHPAQLVLSPARRGGGACGKVSWCSGSCGKACRVEKLASVQGSNTVVLQ